MQELVLIAGVVFRIRMNFLLRCWKTTTTAELWTGGALEWWCTRWCAVGCRFTTETTTFSSLSFLWRRWECEQMIFCRSGAEGWRLRSGCGLVGDRSGDVWDDMRTTAVLPHGSKTPLQTHCERWRGESVRSCSTVTKSFTHWDFCFISPHSLFCKRCYNISSIATQFFNSPFYYYTNITNIINLANSHE